MTEASLCCRGLCAPLWQQLTREKSLCPVAAAAHMVEVCVCVLQQWVAALCSSMAEIHMAGAVAVAVIESSLVYRHRRLHGNHVSGGEVSRMAAHLRDHTSQQSSRVEAYRGKMRNGDNEEGKERRSGGTGFIWAIMEPHTGKGSWTLGMYGKCNGNTHAGPCHRWVASSLDSEARF